MGAGAGFCATANAAALHGYPQTWQRVNLSFCRSMETSALKGVEHSVGQFFPRAGRKHA